MKDDDLVYAVAFMGAPSIIVERLANGSELSNALQLAQHLSDMGFKVNQTNDELQDIANKSNIEIHFNEERNIAVSQVFKCFFEMFRKETFFKLQEKC